MDPDHPSAVGPDAVDAPDAGRRATRPGPQSPQGELGQATGPVPYPRGVPARYALPDVPLTRLLDDAAQDFPETTALRYGRRQLTYRELQDQSDRLATALLRRGLGRGDRVGVALGRVPQAPVTLFALWRIGAVAVLLDPVTSSRALVRRAERTGCRILVCDDRQGARIRQYDHDVEVVVTGPEDALAFPGNLLARARRAIRRRDGGERLLELVHRNAPVETVARSEIAVPAAVFPDVADDLQPTPVPGVRADPAPVSFTHRQLLAAAFHLRLWIPDVVAGGERVLSVLPLSTPLGLAAAVTMPVLSASTSVLADRGRRPAARAAEAADPTVLLAAHRGTARVVEALRSQPGSLRVCLETGIADHAEVSLVEERTGARLRGMWAPVGSAGLVVAEPVYGLTRPGTAGIAVTDSAVRTGPAGTLLVAGPQVVTDPQVVDGSQEVDGTRGVTGDGWRDTGRPGSVDADGYVRFSTP